ncbi:MULTISPECIES: transglutaminase-like cysteine peptidase [unclassified Roseitalea]|uniref:transglutaminase-like cysteine peptidase n=1 Tax=unclassified Roseitalea TaxID=2639107 RepID=UPI00273DE06B|nr:MULTISPECIES: transglutaminase-like cysteine peptidase [unclassified Roseitalea]
MGIYGDVQSPEARRVGATVGIAALLVIAASGARADIMPTNGRTTQPIGHYEFCQRYPAECGSTGRAQPEPLSRAAWQAMIDVNNQVNTTVRPLTDMQIWGREELWSYPTDVGDCEDYVLEKRKRLIDRGFHPSNLLITVVRQPNGDGHAVLTVRTDRGEFILDNLVGQIDDWRDTPYTYLKRQNTAHAGRWVGIDDERARVLASR